MTTRHDIDFLLSLPPVMASRFAELTGHNDPRWFAGSDPSGVRLGSGGGTVHLLHSAFKSSGVSTLSDWLRTSRKLMLHGGGHSRRLPAYAVTGKPLIPMPVNPNEFAQQLDQTLLDCQLPLYERVLSMAPEGIVAMVTSGDVLLRFSRQLPQFPQADVIALGMRVPAEVAQHFGVFFLESSHSERLDFFLQKPEVSKINLLAHEHPFLVDTGMWLLSERALQVLFQKCGWLESEGRFAQGNPTYYELYSDFGMNLGANPKVPDALVGTLQCAVIALPEAEFYHLGTSRQLIETMSILQRGVQDSARKMGLIGEADQFILNSVDRRTSQDPDLRGLWIENSCIGARWQLSGEHVLTGIPDNNWDIVLETGACLDVVPMGRDEFCLRAYGIDDPFRGRLGESSSHYIGRPFSEWLTSHGIAWDEAGLDPKTDLQEAGLFPVMKFADIDPNFLNWLWAVVPAADPKLAQKWIASRRLSALEISEHASVDRLLKTRGERMLQSVKKGLGGTANPGFYRLDLQKTAEMASGLQSFSDKPLPATTPALDRMHHFMFLSAIARKSGNGQWKKHEQEAFSCLRQSLIQEAELSLVRPKFSLLEDQIVWARSPVRLDLAGGWTDTPPYCLEHGGRVVNMAVNLNGQPPVQVFVKRGSEPEIVIRSIDLGVEQRIRSYEQLDTFSMAGSEFALAKAALALCGFLPRFHSEGGYGSLERHLQEFGSGLEISMLAAVPAGSGLGTSSILAATLLGALSEACGLNWDSFVLLERTLIVEQMLTTGGGWQDQAGGVLHGIKLIETASGLKQKPVIRWLPEGLFDRQMHRNASLLYYTGLTRLAKNILAEIVRGMFLNARPQMDVLADIGHNALNIFDAIQRADRDALCRAVATSWELNQQLDAGTNTPEVESILSGVSDYLAGCKLLGAGGGGYLLMLAKDERAAMRIRQRLQENPPNARARFVDFSLSRTGLEVTRS